MAERVERDNRRGGRKGRKKVCAFCVERESVNNPETDKKVTEAKPIDYKDVSKLRRFVSERAKILPRRVTINFSLTGAFSASVF